MVRTASIFGQTLRLVDRVHFTCLARQHQSNHYTKRSTAWDHFVAMAVLPTGGRRRFRFRHKLLSLDATVITLCLNLFPWAEYTRTKGGVKLHLLLDHDGYWPTYAVLSDAKTADVSVARTLALPKGSIVVMDRGYVDYALWGRWTRDDGVSFVTRLKTNVPYRVIETRAIAPSKSDTVLLDQVIQLTSGTARAFCPYRLRRVVVRDPKTGQSIGLVSNHEGLAAHTVGQISRERWQIELYFKALKQNLKVKTFLGTREDALAVQLWTALIAMLLVKYPQWRSRRNWSLSNLVALLRWNLFQHKDLWRWLEDPLGAPMGLPDHPQLVLPGFQIGQLPAQGTCLLYNRSVDVALWAGSLGVWKPRGPRPLLSTPVR